MNIVFLGAGGAGMSNLVYLLRDLGYKNLITIDIAESQNTHSFQKNAIPFILGHGNYQLHPEDILIYSSATQESPEVQQAMKLKREGQHPLKLWNYFQFLGEISKYCKTVGFSGTNGKSSSASLAIYSASQLLPDFGLGIVGALMPNFDNKGIYLDQSKKSDFRLIFDAIFTGKQLPYELIKKYYFFVEACEYQRHFLNLDLDDLLITNIELEHTDYFLDEEDYCSAFLQLIKKTKNKVFVLEDLKEEKILTEEKTEIIPLRDLQLPHFRGKHNAYNITLVLALLKYLNPQLTGNSILLAMQAFRGTWRRLECLHELPGGAHLFSDYGHMASSLTFVHEALKEHYPDKKVTIIFQPHQLQRLVKDREGFKSALALYDHRAIYPIYSAREERAPFEGNAVFQGQEIHSHEEAGIFFAKETKSDYLWEENSLSSYLEERKGDEVVVILTAGDLDFEVRTLLNLI